MNVAMGTIVGREAELRAVETALAADGPAAVLVEGEAGIGKTTVWLAAAAHAEASGSTVLRARPSETEARLSYSVLADLLAEGLERVRDALPPPQADALDVALLRERGTAEPRTIATALVSVVTALAAEAPLVVAVDDVQWLDRASERALAFLARRLPAGARLLLTRRSGSSSPPLELDRATFRTTVVELGPLSLAALHHLVHDRLGLVLPRPVLVKLQDACGGNPFFALELAASLDDWRPALGEAMPIPRDLRTSLRLRIERLPRATRAALLRAAALTRPTTDHVDEDLLGPAEEAGVVRVERGRVEFTHPLLASAVYSHARAEQRRAVHGELAHEVLDVEERARHLALAATRPDASVAALLDDAAAHARSRGAPDAAGELQEQAARLTPAADACAAQERVAVAAEHYFHAGDPKRAHALLTETLPVVADRRIRGEFLRILGELRFTESSFPDAIALLEEALPTVDEPEVAIPIRLDLAYAYLSVQDRTAAAAQVGLAVQLAETHDLRALLAEALAVRAMFDYLAGRGVDRAGIEHALSLEDPSRRVRLMMRPASLAAMLAVSDGRLAEAVERLDAVCGSARDRGEESELPLLLAYLASAHWRRGHYGDAAAAAEEIVRIGTQSGNEPAVAIGLTHRGMSAAYRGRVDEARAALDEARCLMERTGWTLGADYVRMARGFLELSAGDPAAADAELAPVTGVVERGDHADPELALFAPDAIEARLALGDLDRAELLIRALEDRGPHASAWTRTEALRCRALHQAATGDPETALGTARAAADLAQPLEMPFLHARCLLACGRIERRLRRKQASRESLERALEIFDRLGTPLWAERARDELCRLGRRATAKDELTETERRIAELAASGLTNREVAQAAFVSPKTVEANLARVYRKLGIRSRAELGARMAQA